MKKMCIYEGPMCCSTGVCGPSPDEELMRVSSLVDKLRKSGASIDRYNLTNNTKEFVENKTINSLLNEEKGEDILPIVMVDDEVVMTGKYPSNEEFYEMLFLSDDAKEEASNDDGSCCSGSGCCC